MSASRHARASVSSSPAARTRTLSLTCGSVMTSWRCSMEARVCAVSRAAVVVAMVARLTLSQRS